MLFPFFSAFSGHKASSLVTEHAGERVLCAAADSDKGPVRVNNEDNFLLGGTINADCADHFEYRLPAAAIEGWQFAAVFDGMGGGEQGEVAARAAASALREAAQLPAGAAKERVDACVRQAIAAANGEIVSLQHSASVYGTTGTVLCTDGAELRIYHLGDSRAYLLREGELLQLTRDHTLAQLKRELGLYRGSDPRSQAEAHQLTSYIGQDPTGKNIRPEESGWLPVKAGDCMLLCSDGLYGALDDRMILQIMQDHSDPARASKALLRSAVSHGSRDNITCVLLKISAVS